MITGSMIFLGIISIILILVGFYLEKILGEELSNIKDIKLTIYGVSILMLITITLDYNALSYDDSKEIIQKQFIELEKNFNKLESEFKQFKENFKLNFQEN